MTPEEHLINILKIISVGDFDEEIMAKILTYLWSRKVFHIGGPDILPYELEKVEEILNTTNVQRTKEPHTYFEYEVVK